MNEQRVTIAARLYEARGVVRSLAGPTYRAKIAPVMDKVQLLADAIYDGDVLKAAMEIVRKMQADHEPPMLQAWILAAAVELIEPSEAVEPCSPIPNP